MNQPRVDETESFCNTCKNKTTHRIHATHRRRIDAAEPELAGVHWENTYRIVECCGCHSVSFQLEEFFTEADGDPGITCFPSPSYRRKPHWIGKVPQDIKNLHEEVYSALAANAMALAAMGVRAIIDEVGTDKLSDMQSFEKKVTALCDEGFISNARKKVLLEAFDAGSAAAHRAYRPPRSVVEDLIDIAEHLLQDMYQLEDLALDLAKTTPKRKKS